MWWPLLEIPGFSPQPRIDTGRFRFVSVAKDIESLNRRAAGDDLAIWRCGDLAMEQSSAERTESSKSQGRQITKSPNRQIAKSPDDFLEITAISCAQYPFVQDRYALTACGSSMGDQYGPKLVSGRPMSLSDLKRNDVVLAVPGERTSAFAMTSLILGKGSFRHEVVPFDQIIERVARDEFAAGLIIHEGQLTYERAGLRLIEDVGRWWTSRTGLPMPLGANAIRRDLEQLHGPGTLREVTTILKRSVEYALAHREESIEYAMGFGRGLSQGLADQFIEMYVNKWTLDFGPRGREAVRRFFDEGHRAGLFPSVDTLDLIDPM